MTCSFAVIGKSTAKRVSQKVLISFSVPGSCAPKSFAGTPSTTSPLSRFSRQSFSSPSYCGVRPHWLATLTTSTALPLNCVIGNAPPSMERNEKSCAVVMGLSCLCADDRPPAGIVKTFLSLSVRGIALIPWLSNWKRTTGNYCPLNPSGQGHGQSAHRCDLSLRRGRDRRRDRIVRRPRHRRRGGRIAVPLGTSDPIVRRRAQASPRARARDRQPPSRQRGHRGRAARDSREDGRGHQGHRGA